MSTDNTTTNNLTLEAICQSPSLWQEHVNIDGLNTPDNFNSMTFEQRLDLVETLFWYEQDGAEDALQFRH